MTHTPAYTKKFLQRRKFLLVLPLLVTPFLFFLFYSLGGGGSKVPTPTTGSSMGFNPELPKAQFHPKKSEPNKLEFYKQADADSLKRKEWIQQDPYHNKVLDTSHHFPGTEAPQADELLKRLDQLRASMRQPAPYQEDRLSLQQLPGRTTPPELGRLQQVLQSIKAADTSEEDPQLQKLNTMLDKIIRIQHPGETPGTATVPGAGLPHNEGVPADSSSGNAIPATIPEDQTLVAGATITLRLTDSTRIGGILLPKDQLVYGVVSISNDRLLINIHSIRLDHSIYPTDLQVYDMDGLPGIHIPGTLNREVAKQSADQGIGSLNLTTLDPSIGAQAANAGIQTAKTLFSRKVKLVRITVRAGYQVLLYSTRAGGERRGGRQGRGDSLPSNRPPLNPPLQPFMNHHVTAEKLTLTLQGIYLRENILWFSLLLYNDGPIEFLPEYTRWTIRDRHRMRRTAIQDLALSPVYTPPTAVLPGYSNRSWLIGFSPFALAPDKELVLQIGERNGARVLTMVFGHKELLKAKTL